MTLLKRIMLAFLRSTPAPHQVVPVAQTTPTLTTAPQPDQPRARVPYLAVVGESFYQPSLRTLRRVLKADAAESFAFLKSIDKFAEPDPLEFTATLKPEPTNPQDSNAIMVLGPEGEQLGYLQRDVAKQFQKRLLTLGQIECPAELRGGGRGKSVGVVLRWLQVRDRLMAINVPRSPRQKARS